MSSPEKTSRSGRPSRFCGALILSSVFAFGHGLLTAQIPQSVGQCGGLYAEPIYLPNVGSRPCLPSIPRTYKPQHSGLGFEILDIESEACFVPDAAYQLLNSLVDQVKNTAHFGQRAAGDATGAQALSISQQISKTLTANGFTLHIPTDTLSDALYERKLSDPSEHHIFDCDTGRFMFITIAQALNADVSLVEIALSEESTHNYVQWRLSNGQSFNWDTNGQAVCSTPGNLMSYQGKPMTKEQVLGYVYRLRAMNWEKSNKYDRAIFDYQCSIQMYPESYEAYNDLAWLLMTKEVPNRDGLRKEALDLSLHAVSIRRDASRLDTLACAYAMSGDMSSAIKTELAVISTSNKDEFKRRLEYFRADRDCLGEK